MQLPIYQVDAFSRGPFTGNPAAVVPLAKWLPAEQMQKIAEENNLSETAFFVPFEDKYHIRWFTPTVEVALCGHATLATAHVLFDVVKHSNDVVRFTCLSGDISVEKRGDKLTLDFPTDQLSLVDSIPDELIDGLGKQPREVYAGREDYLCVFATEEIVRSLLPDFITLAQVKGRGVIVTAPGEGEFDFVSRGFFPQSGINEDPATGSAHTTLTPYWHKELKKPQYEACQLSSRRGYFLCESQGDRTLISGETNLYLTGSITL